MKTFEQLKPKMETGACVLWRHHALFSDIIGVWTEYTHASLIVRLDKYDLLKDKVFLIEAYENGLEFNDFEQQYQYKDADVYLFVPKGLNRWNTLTIFKNAFELLARNEGYDFAALIESAYHHPDRDPKKFICSEFVDYIWIINGLKRRVENNYAAWPGDIPKWWDGELYTIREEEGK